MRLPCRLGKFLRAAEVVDAMQAFVYAYGADEPSQQMIAAWESSGLATSEWWLTQTARTALVNTPGAE